MKDPLTREQRITRNKQRLAIVLYALLAVSIVFALVRYAQTPADAVSKEPGSRTRNDYGLMVVQCVLGLAVIYLPTFLEKKLRIDIPDLLEYLYLIFLFCAIYLGEVRNFYFRISFWDNILHAMSGGMLAVIGFYIVVILNQWDRLTLHLSPFFVAFFAFCFAAACGVVWEIYEFAVDRLLGMNMQKYLTDTGEALVGAAALEDTMEDLIIDLLSALVVSVLGYFSIRKEKAKEIAAIEGK